MIKHRDTMLSQFNEKERMVKRTIVGTPCSVAVAYVFNSSESAHDRVGSKFPGMVDLAIKLPSGACGILPVTSFSNSTPVVTIVPSADKGRLF